MTYCVGILLDEGVVLASDSRTNAGIDRVSTFRKMFIFEKPGERFFALLTAGNLSLTQGGDQPDQRMAQHRGPGAGSLRGRPRCSGPRAWSARAVREVHKVDGGYLHQHEVDFTALLHLRRPGQGPPAPAVPGLRRRQFHRGDARHDLFPDRRDQIRQAHPRPHHSARHELGDAAKCALISFDSTMRSNVSVGPPIDLMIYRRNSLKGPSDPARGRRSLSPGDPRRLGRRHPQGVLRHQPRSRLELRTSRSTGAAVTRRLASRVADLSDAPCFGKRPRCTPHAGGRCRSSHRAR